MPTSMKRLGAAALVGAAAWLLLVSPAPGQGLGKGPNAPLPTPRFMGGPFMYTNSAYFANPAYRVTPNLGLNQAAYNMAIQGMAQSYSPFAGAFNPYTQPLGGAPFANPLTASPYANPALAASLYANPWANPYSATMTSSPYGGAYGNSPGLGGTGYGDLGAYGGYYPYADPYGGGLRGAAEAIAAQGKFEIQFNQARLLNQEVERSKIDTRRKLFDEWLYERANRPTIADDEARVRKLEYQRITGGVPLSEILNAYALNMLLDDLRKKTNLAVKDTYGPIDPDILKQINITSGSSAGGVGVLKAVKDGGPLNWPLPLQAAAYQDEVRRLNQLAAEAVKLVQNNGQVDANTLAEMREDVHRLRSKVSAHINDLTPSQSIEANRFLNQLDDAARALAQPDASLYFTDKFAGKPKTVGELVKYMADKGLKFAPAVGGDEAAYSALYNYLVGYAMQTAQASKE